MSTNEDIFEAVANELVAAVSKFPEWPTDPLHALAVVNEECGELSKAVLQHVYEPHKANLNDIRLEAVQTAAMAIRFLISLETGQYFWERSHQHQQVAE